MAYFPAPSLFDVQYEARVALALATIDGPDGRLLLSARPADSRVTLSYGDVFFQLAEPPQVCTFRQKAALASITAGGLKLLELSLDAILQGR